MNKAPLLLLHFLAGWVNRRQLEVVEYLKEENIVLRKQLGGRRLRLTDTQRRRLAIRGKAIGRKGLMEVACIVTPDTILRYTRIRDALGNLGHEIERNTVKRILMERGLEPAPERSKRTPLTAS